MLTDREQSLIRTSYASIALDTQGAGETFYEFLFADHPELRSLFVAGLTAQSAKLMSTLGTVVSQIQNWDGLASVVEDLAIRHVAYGVKETHYSAVGDALIKMLISRSSPAPSTETLDAWRKAYGLMSEAMIRAAYHERDGVRSALDPM